MNITLHRNTINHEEQQTVNARELHAFLEVETRFNDWISRRIEQYGFIENQDFVYYSILSETPDAAFSENSEKPQTGRPRVEYALSLDMAKELSMVERTDKGKQARAYFIEMERKAKQAAPALPNFTNPAIAARAWADEVEKNAEQQKRLAVAEPKAAALDLLADSKGASNITLTAKHLKTTRKELIGLLRAKKWIWGTRPIQAAQQVINQGLMIQVAGISDRNGQHYTQALITPKGLAKLAVILQESKA